MNPNFYTKDAKHPDDAINEAKVFINELQQVQETYFNNLLQNLNINENLENWLFDYVYNECSDTNLMFTEYLEEYNKKYECCVKPD